MDIEDWLASAIADAEHRGLPELKPLLDTLARATRSLRQADEELRAEESVEPPNEPAP